MVQSCVNDGIFQSMNAFYKELNQKYELTDSWAAIIFAGQQQQLKKGSTLKH